MNENSNRYEKEQLFTGVRSNSSFKKFCNIHKKTPMLEPIFNKVAGL